VNQFKRFFESVTVIALRRAVFTTWPASAAVFIAWVSIGLYDNETLGLRIPVIKIFALNNYYNTNKHIWRLKVVWFENKRIFFICDIEMGLSVRSWASRRIDDNVKEETFGEVLS